MFTSSMFQSIKDALQKTDSSSSSSAIYNEVLKFKAGNTYVLRLIPNVKKLEDTFFHHYVHGWTSFSNGQYMSALSLQTYNKRDPIAENRYRLLKLGSDEDKKKAETVKRQEYWAVNVYVVDDPVNPENNGKIKILRSGRQLHKIINSAMDGEDAEEFGSRIFEFENAGCNLKVKAEKQGEYTVYTASRFTSPMDLGLSKEKVQSIFDGIHDLKLLNPAKSEEQLQEMWDTHFLCKTTEGSGSSKSEKPVEKQTESKVDKSETTTSEISEQINNNVIDDETVSELLKGLDLDV
jgi:hypothetical protein